MTAGWSRDPWVRAAAAVAALVVVGVVAVLAAGHHAVPQPPRAQAGPAPVSAPGAPAELTRFVADLRRDPAAAASPPALVRARLTDVGADAVAGSLSQPDSAGGCWASTVRAGRAWVVTGDPAALEVGSPAPAPADQCR